MALGGSVLWRVAKIVMASGVAEKTVEAFIDRVKTRVVTPRPASPPREAEGDGRRTGSPPWETAVARHQARLDTLEASVRDQDGKLTTIALGLEKLGEDLRPLMLRSTITFWMALAALVLSLVSLGLALRG